MAEEGTRTDVPEVDPWVAENYESLIADENRNLTWEKVADMAETNNDAALAAYARKRAAGKGQDVTPSDADSGQPKVTRIELQKDGSEKEVEVEPVQPEVGAEKLDSEGHPIPDIDYNAHTIDELKDILQERGIDITGFTLKADYVGALEDADKQATA